MANQEHLDILEQGIEVWNEWRQENVNPAVDLNAANFSEMNFANANLWGVNFAYANLRRAWLGGAYLVAADFHGANLVEASLYHGNLLGARLQHANLSEADLGGVNLQDADLSRANLSGASLNATAFGNTNLTSAEGLNSCRHAGPSTVDHRTLARSGKLPMEFLRGCGLPDFIIDNIPVLQGDLIQFYSCFISYSTKDQAFADRLYADLQNKGIRCWLASADMKIGDPIRKTIYD